MFEFIVLIRDFWKSIISVFDSHPLVIAGYKLSYLSLIFAFLVIGFTISYFWKGAKT